MTGPSETNVFTIGYEGAGQPAVLAALQAAGVRTLIDVRELPLSRRAGFSKTVLAASLAAVGISYLHLRALGTPKEGRLASRAGRKAEFWQVVESGLQRPEAEADLARAAAIAREGAACLLCFEASHTDCHRKRVAELLSDRYGLHPVHLAPDPGF
jgi:uncharacterized protein (DUF488 family)